MNRCVAFFFALLCAALTVSSACVAQSPDGIHFSLERDRDHAGKIRAEFRDERATRDRSDWSTGFMPSDLIGLEVSSFRAAGTRPLHFAVVREAGRLDCAGNGGNEYAAGNCRFAENAAFSQLLVSRGIGRASFDQAFALMAVNARRETIDALAAARYPMPSIDDLTALAALNVNGAYIADMSRAGYRPASVRSLIEFKALGITPQWIGGFARVGYANLPGDDLVQLRALNVTPDYIAGFQRIGYRNLSADKLVELKALNITPEFVVSMVGQRSAMPPVGDLVEMKMFGKRR